MALTLPSSAPSSARQALAVDTRSLNNLKLEAGQNSPDAAKEAAKQFESLFMRELIKSMREATMKSGLLDSAGGVDVGNVVASRLQGHLVGHQGASADVEQSHDLHRFHHACAFWARSALWMAPLSFLAYSGSVA